MGNFSFQVTKVVGKVVKQAAFFDFLPYKGWISLLKFNHMAKSIRVPAGYQPVMPYLIVPNAEGFIHFMENVFDATQKMKVMRDESKGIVMHGEVEIDGSVIMFADSTEKYPPMPASMFIYVEDADQSYQQAMEAGATSLSEPADQTYGRSCGVKDPHGNTWWITSIKL
jgi:PhnB protein